MRRAGFLFFFGLIFSTNAVSTETNIAAKNCEVFVDGVVAYYGAYSNPFLTFFIKTLNYRLDGEITEVGFHSRQFGYDADSVSHHGRWIDVKATSFINSKDYWTIKLIGRFQYEGAFYVKTSKGTVYWHGPLDVPNFPVTSSLFDYLIEREPENCRLDSHGCAISTRDDALSYFNSDRCY
ncbi:MAG: hypothetical protein A3K03_02865 [Bdellovibrionales bacterium RIFOXYD1_FULL_44_7]|nr:MAG: hypothetical protein A3K03_02865 [Bdellovibrionales bacterium RIFOXYD1_FULL_44_7]